MEKGAQTIQKELSFKINFTNNKIKKCSTNCTWFVVCCIFWVLPPPCCFAFLAACFAAISSCIVI